MPSIASGDQRWVVRALDGMTATTLAGNVTLTIDDTSYQKLDPDGSNRDVTLPSNTQNGRAFWIVNAADAAENLVVKNAAGSTLGTVNQGEAGVFFCIGTTWTFGFIITIALS